MVPGSVPSPLPLPSVCYFLFFFTVPPPPEIYTLSLHDALPISLKRGSWRRGSRSGSCSIQARNPFPVPTARSRRSRAFCESPAEVNAHAALYNTAKSVGWMARSEEHTSELQSPCNLVCRLLLEK